MLDEKPTFRVPSGIRNGNYSLLLKGGSHMGHSAYGIVKRSNGSGGFHGRESAREGWEKTEMEEWEGKTMEERNL